MISFLIWGFTGLIFIGAGTYALRAKAPVRFWNVQQEIEVTDIKQYNHAVALLWFGFTFFFYLLGIPFLRARQNSPVIIVTILGTMILVILLMVVYTRIEKKYRVK